MKLLVTGGAGFIGSNFIRLILGDYPSISIVCYDALTYAGNLCNLEGLKEKYPDRYAFEHGNICSRDQVRSTFKAHNFAAVAHFAAESHVDRSIEASEVFVRTNVLGTQVLLDAAVESGIHCFLQVSTDEVYGSLEDKDEPWTENSPLAPNNPYAASKAGAECLCRSYWKTYKLPIIISRSSDNYGPYQFPEKFIPLCITNCAEDKSLPLYGDGSNIRDWIFVEDNCRALALLLLKGKPGNAYNIGGDNYKINREVAELILELMGKPRDLIRYVLDRKGHDYRYAMNCGKIRKEVGWSPQVSFEKGIRRTIDWYIKNKVWMEEAIRRSKAAKE